MIAEYTSKAYTFKTTPEQSKFLDSLDNKAEFIREAIQEKMVTDDVSKSYKYSTDK